MALQYFQKGTRKGGQDGIRSHQSEMLIMSDITISGQKEKKTKGWLEKDKFALTAFLSTSTL